MWLIRFVPSLLGGICGSIGYLLPMTTLMLLFGAKFTLRLAKIAIALVIRVKSFIPTMGA